MTIEPKLISVVVPCFNEEPVLSHFYQAMEKVRKELPHKDIEYIFINDGSNDETLSIIRELSVKDSSRIKYVSFSRNFGKEAAIYAGLEYSAGDYVVIMDADLQDPPEMLPQMVYYLEEEGYDCVGTRRVTRVGEPPIRSFFARQFYKIINRVSNTEILDGVRDYRLMTRQMVDAILSVTEYNRFSKGIFSWVGFETKYLEYENRERVAGETSWSFWSLFKYSIDGIISFSEAPLAIASFIGFISFIGALVALLFIIIRTLIFGDPTSGWPSMISIFLMIGGLQLLCMGILGKYIGKTFLETKKRPIYIVKETEKK